MYDYLVNKGMDAGRLLLEDQSRNTIENIENARALIGDGHRTAVVTSDYHLARARVLMERGGLDACGIPAPTPYPGTVGRGALPGILLGAGADADRPVGVIRRRGPLVWVIPGEPIEN